MPLLVDRQRTPEWEEARLGRITASLAAACLGLDPNFGPYAAYSRIMGLSGRSAPNRFQQHGNQFEPDARRDYECESGNLVYETGFWVHPDLPWLGASPDGLIDDDGGLEIKCPSEMYRGVSVHHRLQCIVNMLVTEREWWDYYVWVMSERAVYRIYRPKHCDGLIRKLKRFYDVHIATASPPPRRRPFHLKRWALEKEMKSGSIGQRFEAESLTAATT